MDMISIKVVGHGIVAEIFQDLVDLLQPLLKHYDVDLLTCLPSPHHPDYNRYAKIAFFILLCWILLIFEPIGSRMRTSIMEIQYPERSLERTVWLYHHILRKRTSFVKFARRQVRRKRLKDNEHMTFVELLRSKFER